jgi:hypothetical protein
VTLYEVLGVRADASTREIRQSYLARARRCHPDFHADADLATRQRNERQMRELNDAWAVLGDPARRATYDTDLRLSRPGPAATPAGPAGAADPDEYVFVPYDDDDTDYAALLDDAPPGNGARLPRAVQLAPVGLLAAALFFLSTGLVTNLGAMYALGFTCLVLSGACFVLTPALAVMRSLQSDRE